MTLFQPEYFNMFLITMAAIAVIVFVALHYVEAGYGIMYSRQWGPSVPNRTGWVLMEAPVFVVMAVLWIFVRPPFRSRSGSHVSAVRAALFPAFVHIPVAHAREVEDAVGNRRHGDGVQHPQRLHAGRMDILCRPADYYDGWFGKPFFYVGALLFFAGMFINWQSDHIIRHLRKEGDTRHYIPRGGMFRYVSSANYFGEVLEWTGFAVASWSTAGLLFVWWTFANLAPPLGLALPALREGVRRGVHLARSQTHHPLPLLMEKMNNL